DSEGRTRGHHVRLYADAFHCVGWGSSGLSGCVISHCYQRRSLFMSHTIAAVSTGSQVSAIGILRLSGDDCIEVADRVFSLQSGKSLQAVPDRKLMLGVLRDK